VQVDDDRIRIDLIYALDRLQPVECGRDNGQARLLLDEQAKRLEIAGVVVRNDDADRAVRPSLLLRGTVTYRSGKLDGC
jgi:hypothetical protein